MRGNCNMKPTTGKQKGFTLLELMVVVVIISILTAMTVGGYGTMIAESRVNDVSNRLRGFIALARNEAISRGGNVRLCGSVDGFTCVASMDSGWLIYHDNDNDDVLGAADEVVSWQEQEHAATAVAVVDTAGNAVNHFEFNYRGFPSAEMSVTTTSNTLSRVVVVHRTGRLEQL